MSAKRSPRTSSAAVSAAASLPVAASAYVSSESLPWFPLTEGVHIKLCRASLSTGQCVMFLRAQPGADLGAYCQHGVATVYTVAGRWRYREADWLAGVGDVVVEPAGSTHSFEVVGIARDLSRPGGPDDPLLYLPWNPNNPANPFVRFAGDGAALAPVVTNAIRDIAPELPVTAGTLQSLEDEQTAGLWRATQLVVFVCAIAVVLSVIGIYGVVAFAVSQRTKEIGIRIALGAVNRDIYQAVLGSRWRSIAVGLLIGVTVTMISFSAMSHLLRDVNFRNPMMYVITGALLVGVALAAMVVPARRATKVDPMVALRHE